MNSEHVPARVLNTPLSDEDVLRVRCGERVILNGVIFTARDEAHKRMANALKRGESLPFEPQGQVIYYMGPSPAPPGKIIGSAGPTTSCRMDPYAPALYEAGVKATIGKGPRAEPVRRAVRQCRALYLAAIGGAGALLAARVKQCEVIAYDDLGPEAVRRLVVEEFPAVVINDAYGGDFYQEVARSRLEPAE